MGREEMRLEAIKKKTTTRATPSFDIPKFFLFAWNSISFSLSLFLCPFNKYHMTWWEEKKGNLFFFFEAIRVTRVTIEKQIKLFFLC